MNYSPRETYVWDSWAIASAGKVHCYHLQCPKPGSSLSWLQWSSIGHAISDDLICWHECEPAIAPGPNGELDDDQLWTGCCFENAGVFYLYYTMRQKRDQGAVERIGVALSDDLYNWRRYDGNPVIVPDRRWYRSQKEPHKGPHIDCRDLVVVKDLSSGYFYGFYAARVPGKDFAKSSVIAAVRSEDLLHWENVGPAFASGRDGQMEMPDVFHLDGRWYMTVLAGTQHGTRSMFSDPHVTWGTMYAVSEAIAGPYEIIEEDNVLIGGLFESGFSCRSVAFEGTRYLLYTDRERSVPNVKPVFGSLTIPKILATDGSGRLRATYCDRIERLATAVVIKEPDLPDLVYKGISYVSGSHRSLTWWAEPTGTWSRSFDTIEAAAGHGFSLNYLKDIAAWNFIFSVRISSDGAAAIGVVVRCSEEYGQEEQTHKAGFVVIDLQKNELSFSNSSLFETMRKRKLQVPTKNQYDLKVVARREHLEVYVDSVLMLQFPEYELTGREVGLFVDRGRARFSEFQLLLLPD